MDYKNDIQRHIENKRTEDVPSSVNSFNNKSFIDFTSKKTEKLVMALYMVTDGIDMDESLKNKLRSLGVELMSDIHRISSLYKTQKSFSILSTQSKILEILSFIDVSQTIGFISEMNAGILKKEFDLLAEELIKFEETNQVKNMNRDLNSRTISERFVLDKESLFVALPDYEKLPQLNENIRQDTYKGHIKDSINHNVFYKKYSPIATQKDTNKNQVTREERRNQIKDFLKDKDFLSIKDISVFIKDCSEKTIQRELNELVSNGQVLKEGEKRWSKYKYSPK